MASNEITYKGAIMENDNVTTLPENETSKSHKLATKLVAGAVVLGGILVIGYGVKKSGTTNPEN